MNRSVGTIQPTTIESAASANRMPSNVSKRRQRDRRSTDMAAAGVRGMPAWRRRWSAS
jgi:hypothetical protein